MSVGYVVRPKADQDLDDQAYYLATQAGPDLGHRFLLAAHQTFGLLATQPQIGWHPRLKHPDLTSLRAFQVSASKKCWCSIVLAPTELRFCECCTVREISKPYCIVKGLSKPGHSIYRRSEDRKRRITGLSFLIPTSKLVSRLQ